MGSSDGNSSMATAERYWTYARIWLYAELKDQDLLPTG